MAAPHDVLDLSTGVDDEEIERAYRERVKEAHPDQGGSIEEFREVRTAYERLISGRPTTEVSSTDDRINWTTSHRDYRAVTAEVTYLNYDVLGDYGWGIDDENLFGQAARADLAVADHGQFRAEPGESLLVAAENRGRSWPFACRGGACANCAIMIHGGELSMPVNHVLPVEMLERDIRLSCNGIPITDELNVIYNVKHMPEMEDLLLPPRPFEQAQASN